MICPRISVLLVLLTCTVCQFAHAQRFSPALDPNCYQPRLGVPDEIDTIYGSYDAQQLGSYQFSNGPAPGESYNRVFFSGYPNNRFGWDIVTGGPHVNIHDLNKPKGGATFFGFPGHFHNSTATDLLVNDGNWRIYWADSNGMYDSLRSTVLAFQLPRQGILAIPSHLLEDPPYIAHLVSDTVDDLILGYITGYQGLPVTTDSLYYGLYKGGAGLYQPGGSAMNVDYVYSGLGYRGYRQGSTGDFRGVDRIDFLAHDDHANLFYYKNDAPFSFSAFALALVQDTLYAPWENPEVDAYWGDIRAVRALPKKPGDRSMDLEGGLSRNEPRTHWSENFWRGGPAFGSKRLRARDTDFVINSPDFYDPSWMLGWGGSTTCGDMTGTGNPVIQINGSDPTTNFQFFYVLGEAADPYADMFYEQYYGGITGDTITADGDLYEDLIGGNPSYRIPGGGQDGVGTIELIHGSSRIPVRLNPRFASVPLSVQAGDSLRIAPNPCSTHTVVTWESSCSGTVELQLYDVMGRQVFEERRPTTGSLESFSLDLPHLASGEYFLVLIQEPCIQRGRILIQQ